MVLGSLELVFYGGDLDPPAPDGEEEVGSATEEGEGDDPPPLPPADSQQGRP
jgi:hypothetical protein